MVVLTLDALPPSANSIWRAVHGRVLVSAQYRKWLQETAWRWREQAGSTRLDGCYALHVKLGIPDRRKRDLDNRIKPLSDALVKSGVVQDDSLCMRLKVEWSDEVVGTHVLVIPTLDRRGVQG